MKAWREKGEGSFLWKHQCNEHGEEGMKEEEIKKQHLGFVPFLVAAAKELTTKTTLKMTTRSYHSDIF